MINYRYEELFKKGSIDKQFQIVYDGGKLTNVELHQENFELTESLCSEPELRFGCCEASEVKFRISSSISLKNKKIDISMILNDNPNTEFALGKYKVYSDVMTADKRFRDIIAYDKMHEIINMNVADWYNSLNFPMNLNTFRNLFFLHVGVGFSISDGSLPNDNMIIEKTIEPTELSGRDVLFAIGEINGAFPHINRNGLIVFCFLEEYQEGLYPSNDLYPSDELLPRNVESTYIGKSSYINCTYEDFTSKKIGKLQIRQSEDDVGVSVGDGENTYIVQDNFLLYGKSTEELKKIASNMFEKIKNISYRPFNLNKSGNPCAEVGDSIRITTKYTLIDTYILRRTLKGIQSLKDTYAADGVEEYSGKINSVTNQIIQLKGKTNTIEQNLEETKLSISDVEKGLRTEINQTADSIRTEVNSVKKELQEQIDGVLGKYTGSEIPTINNYPANQWTTTDTKDKAIGSLYFVNSEGGEYAGFTYRWEKLSDGTYQWALLKDTEITQALKELEELQNKLLTEYMTKDETNSLVEQTSKSIKSTVAKSTGKWDLSSIPSEIQIDYYMYGTPTENNILENSENYGKYYLDVENGIIYYCQRAGSSYYWDLKYYLLTVQEYSNTQIEQTSENITSTVAKSQKIWDKSKIPSSITISFYGFGEPSEKYPPSSVYNNKYYLDQEEGKVYICSYENGIYKWSETLQLDSIEESLTSKIEQNKNNIELEVSRAKKTEDILSSRIELTVEDIQLEVSNGSTSAGITITVKTGDGKTQKITKTIEMNGLVSFKNLETEGQTVISGSNITTGIIDAKKVTVKNVKAASVDAENITGTTISGKTISGGKVTGAEISSSNKSYETNINNGVINSTLIRLINGKSETSLVPGIVKMNSEQTEVINSVYIADRETILDKPVYISKGLGGTSANYPNAGIVAMGRTYSKGIISPTDDEGVSCGSSNYKWTQIYAKKDTINTSDENDKKEIKEISEKYEKLFHKIEPLTYMFNNGDRVHIGTTSQRLEKAMKEVGISDLELSAFCKDVKLKTVVNENGEAIEVKDLDKDGKEQYKYGVRYGEFIMLNTHMIQKVYKKIEQQQEEIEELKSAISFLMEK